MRMQGSDDYGDDRQLIMKMVIRWSGIDIDKIERERKKIGKGYIVAFGGSDMPPRGAGREKRWPSGVPDGFD